MNFSDISIWKQKLKKLPTSQKVLLLFLILVVPAGLLLAGLLLALFKKE
ncbi:MAG: hypothetical protein GX116_08620 [Fibrobacter sp.]|nr:hypothetical protein [Fibrobacter sp.]